MRARAVSLSDGTMLTVEWKGGADFELHYQDVPHGKFHTKRLTAGDIQAMTLAFAQMPTMALAVSP